MKKIKTEKELNTLGGCTPVFPWPISSFNTLPVHICFFSPELLQSNLQYLKEISNPFLILPNIQFIFKFLQLTPKAAFFFSRTRPQIEFTNKYYFCSQIEINPCAENHIANEAIYREMWWIKKRKCWGVFHF